MIPFLPYLRVLLQCDGKTGPKWALIKIWCQQSSGKHCVFIPLSTFKWRHSGVLRNVRGNACFCCGRMPVSLFEHAHTHARTRASAPPPAAVGFERVASLRPNKGKAKGLKRQKGTQENIALIHFQDPIATVTSVTSKPKSKWRPLPLDTVVRVAAQSLGPTHSKFRISKNICEVSSFFFSHLSFVYLFALGLLFNQPPLLTIKQSLAFFSFTGTGETGISET